MPPDGFEPSTFCLHCNILQGKCPQAPGRWRQYNCDKLPQLLRDNKIILK
jgi:hypothetical protein